MTTLSKPRIAVLLFPGTNCHEETAYAFQHATGQAGGDATIVLINELCDGTKRLSDFDASILAGGFSYGDHVAAGRIASIFLTSKLGDDVRQLLIDRKPILGICNGFQILTETGLLPSGTLGQRHVALLQNNSAVFEHRPVQLLFQNTECIFTRNLAGRTLMFPSAHAEGRISSSHGLNVACRYVDENGRPTEAYPANPNGSPMGIAGITDPTGLIFGLMPHPERAIEDWHASQDGRLIFHNLISYLNQS